MAAGALIEGPHFRSTLAKTAIPLGCLILSSCDRNGSDFTIANGDARPVENVVITARGEIWRLGHLPPGHEVAFHGRLQGEGVPTITWSVGGRRHSTEGCYYTEGMPFRGALIIKGAETNFRCE